MNDSTRPTSPLKSRLRARIGRARRRAAVVTSAGLIAAGGGVMMASGPVDAEPSGSTVETAPATLLPTPMMAASDVRAEPEPVELVPAETEGETIPGGEASYYGRGLVGNPTANGERFDPSDLTAAHRTLPFGTRVRVTNTETGESVVVRVNDRGPFHGDRVIDVSRAAADAIGLTQSGTAHVDLETLPAQGTRG